MTIICCKVCKSAPNRIREGRVTDETKPLLLEPDGIDGLAINETTTTSEEDAHQMSIASETVASQKKTLLGMIVVAIGTALFCSVGAIVQHHGGSVLQLMLGRYVTQNIISWIVWFINPCKTKSTCTHWYGDRGYRINIWIRGFLLFCTIFFWWRGLELLPIGDGEAILFLSPITTVIAARFLLGEPLPSTFFLTLIITVSGLIFICQPTFIFGGGDFVALSWEGILFLLATVIAWSGACVLVRTAKKAHWLQLEITATTQAIIIWCPLVIALNRFWLHSDDLSGGDWDWSLRTGIVMMVIGILGFLALMLNVIGYQIGDATKVAWMEYLDLVFAFLYQWLYFKDIPTTWEIVGCCMLLSTCIIHLGEEYYHYYQAKKVKHKEDKKELETIRKAKEGMLDFRRLSDENEDEYYQMESDHDTNQNMIDINESKPLLFNDNEDKKKNNKMMGLVNRFKIFKSNNDYTQINE